MKISRRDFLILSLLVSSYVALGANEDYKSIAQTTSPKKAEIIVVGAGIAGLGAARYLKDKGYDVIILEARERLGGRIWTDRSLGGLSLDLGASWIHGIKDNPITKLAEDFKVKTLKTDYDSLVIGNHYGKFLTDDQQAALENRLNKLLKTIDRYREKLQDESASDISLKKAFDVALSDLKLSAQELEELNYAINTTIEHEYAADIANLSLFNWDQEKEFSGGDVLFPDGYDQIIKGLAQGLDVRKQHIVKKIVYDDQGVNVVTSKGNFRGDRVIVTLPLGVLKTGMVEFSPSLPRGKQKAIERLGMGILNKVYLRFPQVFWSKDEQIIGYIAQNKGEWAENLNIYKYINQPVLLCFNAAKYGVFIEKLSDGKIIAEVMKVLRTLYGSRIPNPQAWLITRWGQDPFALGSYSFLPPGSGGRDYNALAQPVGDRVFFAGEATSSEYPATVHGALLSGVREGKRIEQI